MSIIDRHKDMRSTPENIPKEEAPRLAPESAKEPGPTLTSTLEGTKEPGPTLTPTPTPENTKEGPKPLTDPKIIIPTFKEMKIHGGEAAVGLERGKFVVKDLGGENYGVIEEGGKVIRVYKREEGCDQPLECAKMFADKMAKSKGKRMKEEAFIRAQNLNIHKVINN